VLRGRVAHVQILSLQVESGGAKTEREIGPGGVVEITPPSAGKTGEVDIEYQFSLKHWYRVTQLHGGITSLDLYILESFVTYFLAPCLTQPAITHGSLLQLHYGS
jgi:hypothetical protein